MAHYAGRILASITRFTCQNPLAYILSLLVARPGYALLIFLLSLLSCGKAVGGTYYVDPVHGDDSYDGRAAVHEGGHTGPWKTISRINEESFLPGDSILLIRGGVWTDGPLEPHNGGEPGGVITIEDTVIDQPIRFEVADPKNHNCVYFGAYGSHPEKPRIDCQGGQGIVIKHNYIIVEDIHLDNGGNNMLWLGRDNGTSWIVIDSVEVTNCSANAVRSSFGGGNIWLKDLYVYNYGVNGILLNGSPGNKLRDVLVEGCWIENPEVLELEDAITCHRDQEENDLAGNIIIRNNTTLRAGEDGVDITTGSHILVAGNTTKFSHAGGIYVNYEWVNNVEIRGNFIYGNSISQGYGDLTVRSPNVRAVNNIVAGSGHHCVLVGNTDNTQFWNNVIAPSNRTGNLIWLREGIGRLEFKNNIFDFSRAEQDISGDITDSIVFDHNCYFGSSRGQEVHEGRSFQEMREADPSFEPNGMWADPKFAHPAKNEPEHFRIALFSACRDAGLPLSVPEDLWGNPRPQNNGIDLGAHEVVSKAPVNPGDISGRAWQDKNGNCSREASEPALARLIIDLYGEDGKFIAMDVSGSDGSFLFEGLPPGNYRLEASALNFNPGQPFEHLNPSCAPEKGSALPASVEAGKTTRGLGLGLARMKTPAVRLANFDIDPRKTRIDLHWTTSLEKNIDFFEVERSDDGTAFFPIGQAKSQGDTDGRTQSYRFTDEKPADKLAYYRLKQVEKSGRFSYSGWRLARVDGSAAAVKAFPNPFSSQLNVSLQPGTTAESIWIIDQNGKLVFKKRIAGAGPDISLSLSTLPKGTYYLILHSGEGKNERIAIPVMKQ